MATKSTKTTTKPASPSKPATQQAGIQAPLELVEYAPEPVGVEIAGVDMPENTAWPHRPKRKELEGRLTGSVWMRGVASRITKFVGDDGGEQLSLVMFVSEYLGHAIPGKGLKVALPAYLVNGLEDFCSMFVEARKKGLKGQVVVQIRLKDWKTTDSGVEYPICSLASNLTPEVLATLQAP